MLTAVANGTWTTPGMTGIVTLDTESDGTQVWVAAVDLTDLPASNTITVQVTVETTSGGTAVVYQQDQVGPAGVEQIIMLGPWPTAGAFTLKAEQIAGAGVFDVPWQVWHL